MDAKEHKNDHIDDDNEQKDDKTGDGLMLKMMFDELHVNRSEFAKKMNISRTTITLWYAKHSLSIDKLIRIEKALGVDISSYFPKLRQHEQREKNLEKAFRHQDGSDQVKITKDQFTEYQTLKQKVGHLEQLIVQKDTIITTLQENILLLKAQSR